MTEVHNFIFAELQQMEAQRQAIVAELQAKLRLADELGAQRIAQ